MLPQQSLPNVTYVIPVAVNCSYCTPDDGYGKYTKHVEWSCNKIKIVLHLVGHFVCIYIHIEIYKYKSIYRLYILYIVYIYRKRCKEPKDCFCVLVICNLYCRLFNRHVNKMNLFLLPTLLLLLILSYRPSSVGIATRYRLDGPGNESRWGARFSAHLDRPGAHPASCTMGTASFPGVKRPGRGVDHPPPFSVEVKERVKLYLHSSFGPS
jgi:hypothetical protein